MSRYDVHTEPTLSDLPVVAVVVVVAVVSAAAAAAASSSSPASAVDVYGTASSDVPSVSGACSAPQRSPPGSSSLTPTTHRRSYATESNN